MGHASDFMVEPSPIQEVADGFLEAPLFGGHGNVLVTRREGGSGLRKLILAHQEQDAQPGEIGPQAIDGELPGEIPKAQAGADEVRQTSVQDPTGLGQAGGAANGVTQGFQFGGSAGKDSRVVVDDEGNVLHGVFS